MKTLYESITQSRFTRREIDESILDTDSKIKSDVIIKGIYNKIKDILIDLYGQSYKIFNTPILKKEHEHTQEIIFNDNVGFYKTFTDATQALKKELNRIDDVESTYKIYPAYKILRGYSKDGKFEVVVWGIFYNDQKILEFMVDNIFVNYINPTSGLHYEIIVPVEYQSFVDLF